MHMTKVSCLLLVLLCCELCSSIKVPVTWDESASSEVKNEPIKESVEIIVPQNVPAKKPSYYKPVPTEYFEYTAQKPKFAADIAAFHGVQNPQDHYKAYPVKPFTGKQKPVLGIHQILDEKNKVFQPFQSYVQQNGPLHSYVTPIASNYEVFHPYHAEEPALEAIYKDPVLTKIRNDLQDSKNRLQNYEKEAGEPNITKDEYLESPEKTDSKLFSPQNIPAQYEIHRPQRKPAYYGRPYQDPTRNNLLNKKFKHPWNQHAKIRPVHYRPLHHHIRHLRKQHAMKYDDEQNEYPQVLTSSNVAEPQDGYDIYENGKHKYERLRNNLDESVNKIAQQNRPANYQKLELQKQETADENEDDEDEFVPVKNYAQVRKTETYKHLPKKAAFDDAETYEEILNAPRLREAVKSTKAQTVYSEEGYEDSAYDHAGEQKHASDHEGHGGFLKEHENSGGLYKIPTFSGKYSDGRGLEYRDNLEHGEKWKNNNKDDEEETDSENYSEDEHEENIEANLEHADDPEVGIRNKRQGSSTNESENSANSEENTDRIEYDDDSNENNSNDDDSNQQENIAKSEHGVGKREVNFEVPEINITSTLSLPKNDPNLEKLKAASKIDGIKEKYPYYFNRVKGINKNSPLRYAENLKLIPRKSKGGTEFYDSRSQFECSEVDEEVDPIPDKLKNGENPTNSEEDEDENSNAKKSFETVKKQPRLIGLGDKIDCFKAKYFGENPLDSPFFKEEIVSNPEPIIAPKLLLKGELSQKSKLNDIQDKLSEAENKNVFILVDKLRADQKNLQESINKTRDDLITTLYTPDNNTQHNLGYTDILKNIPAVTIPIDTFANGLLNSNASNSNKTYTFFKNKEVVTFLPAKLRRKRATPFVYEPYKIIRDSQVQDSKKTTTTSNISPLIKQLQSSRVAERVSRSNIEDRQPKRTYVDIGRKDRPRPTKNDNGDATFVDVSVDHRRGEPRYEIRPANHKTEYTPVENKRAMTVDAYKSHTTTERSIKYAQKVNRGRQRFQGAQINAKPYYDVAQFIPKSTDSQNAAASNTIKKTSTSPVDASKSTEDYEEDDDVDEITSTSTTTSPKPSFRRRIKLERTPQKSTSEEEPEQTTEMQRLKLVTRFRNYKPAEEKSEETEATKPKIHQEGDETIVPKYREKKKKSHASTIVTDIKKYGDDDEEDMKKEEVDALIGVKSNMDDYIPMYEKEEDDKIAHHRSKKNEKHDSNKSSDETKNNESDDEDDDDEDDVYEDYDDDDDDENDDDDDEDDEDDDDDDDEEDESKDQKVAAEEVQENFPQMPEVATTHPIKHTLAKTTLAPPTTVPTRVRTTTPVPPVRNVRIIHKPVVTRKKIEIHKESPANKSSPHMTQFKQDIKEVEIIKEMPAVPKKKHQNKAAALELYKDDSLAKAINDLSDVDVFVEKTDLEKGPKHGGNYRKATKEDLRLTKLPADDTGTNHPKDAETSQSKSSKHIELDDYVPKRLHGGTLKAMSDIEVTTESSRSSKLIELSEPPTQSMHGGNLRYDKRRKGGRNQKLVEFGSESIGEHSSSREGDNHRHSGNERMHGGNYKSAKLVTSEDNDSVDIQVKSTTNNARINSADLLNSFAQAVPILTTTPGYIVDPSKRMYYYVDA
ncbi:hypothetical protein HF086_000027 [Spodoptera exigua]|uniref:Uncharacterized protein n=1 Tax=Spodoptera exigua TaxID=7107 RepID=A0A922SS93_SPOEX|nr:hypothetical protein HF086_000027 [Spodoptera exigua]